MWVTLRGVSFSIKDGEHLAVTGASGSGKSTLLALIGALDRPTSGALHFSDVDLSRLGPTERARYRFAKVGFVFQEFHLLSHLTVLENVLAPFLGRGRERQRHRDVAMELLGAVGLQEVAQRPAGVLSGGEKQRVAIARALVNDPSILLCDEPTGNLDSTNSAAVLDLLERLAKTDERKILICVTHDPKVAARFPRQLRMADGQIVALAAVARPQQFRSDRRGRSQSLLNVPPTISDPECSPSLDLPGSRALTAARGRHGTSRRRDRKGPQEVWQKRG